LRNYRRRRSKDVGVLRSEEKIGKRQEDEGESRIGGRTRKNSISTSS